MVYAHAFYCPKIPDHQGISKFNMHGNRLERLISETFFFFISAKAADNYFLISVDRQRR